MDLYSTALVSLGAGGTLGKVALVSLAWTLAACIGNLAEAIRALVVFSREGPVMPPLLPQLELKWVSTEFRLAIWRWLRRGGLVVQFGTVVCALILAGQVAVQVLRSGLVARGWNDELATVLHLGLACTLLFVTGILVALLLGGLSMLLVVRASNYVRASNALVTRDDIERVRKMLGRLEEESSEEVLDFGELSSPTELTPSSMGTTRKSEDWPT